LTPGESYVVAYYTATNNTDIMTTIPSGLVTNPAITLGDALVDHGGFFMPTTVVTFEPYRIGPNFLFETIPEPSAICLALLSFAGVGSMRLRKFGRNTPGQQAA
jgi:hypothetical protein